MANLLSNRARDRNNNFNLIRFVAASMVLFSHSYPLSNSGPDPLERLKLSCGFVAVNLFFIASGFLVTGSLLSRGDLISFFKARVLRIFPGLVVALIYCAFIIGPIFTTLPLQTYLADPAVYQFLYANATLILSPIVFGLPGVFEHNPYKFAVNGSLWTLPWEIKMYLLLLALGVVLKLVPKRAGSLLFKLVVISIAVIATSAYLWEFCQPAKAPVSNYYYWFMMLSWFFTGSLFWVIKDKIVLSHKSTLLCVLSLLLTAKYTPIFLGVYTLTIGYLMFYLAYFPGGIFQWFNRLGDYSYGMYIYAFPTQQAVMAIFPGIGIKRLFILAFLCTLFLSVISWHWVEQPMLKLKEAGRFAKLSLSSQS